MDEIFTHLKQLKSRALLFTVITLASVAALFLVAILFQSPICIIFAIPVVICSIMTAKTSKAYSKYYKANVVKGILAEVIDDLKFDPHDGISRELVRSTEMMNTGDRFRSNDLISGKYKNVGFRQSDVHIEVESTDSDGHTSYSTLFQGRWITLNFNKDFRCDMQIVAKYFGASKRKGGLFASKEEKLNKIEFENEIFNKTFKTYAQDQQEAFYLMTPHMMEAILKLKEDLKAPIMLMFVGGVLHIAVNNHKDAFEPKIFGKLDPQTERARILGDIGVVTAFIDGMALDRDIYKN